MELRSSKEIVASFGWLEDLPMLVNRLQFFLFFNSFSGFSCPLCYFCALQLANAYRWLGTLVFKNCFIIWGHLPAGLDQNQRCEVEIQHAEIHRDETSRASILQSTATSSRRTWSRNHLDLGRKRGICWFPIFWGKAGRSENWKWTRHCSKKCSIKVPGLAQWKNETTLWGKEFGNRSQRVVPSTRFDPHFGEDVCGTTVKTFFLSRSVPWERSLAPCHGRVCLWWHSQRRRGTGWNWFGKTPLFLKVGGLNGCWNSSKSLSSPENLSESRAQACPKLLAKRTASGSSLVVSVSAWLCTWHDKLFQVLA